MSTTLDPIVPETVPEHPVAPYLRMERIPHVWCPTCGIGTVVQCYVVALKRAEMELDKVSVVSVVAGFSILTSGKIPPPPKTVLPFSVLNSLRPTSENLGIFPLSSLFV